MKLPEPMNANERFLYAVAVRLDAIIEQNNSIIDVLSKQTGVAVTSNKEEITKTEVKAPAKRTRKKVE